jgi:hypothetical protein
LTEFYFPGRCIRWTLQPMPLISLCRFAADGGMRLSAYRDIAPPELAGITAFATLSGAAWLRDMRSNRRLVYKISMSNVLIDHRQTSREAPAPHRRASFLTLGTVRC